MLLGTVPNIAHASATWTETQKSDWSDGLTSNTTWYTETELEISAKPWLDENLTYRKKIEFNNSESVRKNNFAVIRTTFPSGTNLDTIKISSDNVISIPYYREYIVDSTITLSFPVDVSANSVKDYYVYFDTDTNYSYSVPNITELPTGIKGPFCNTEFYLYAGDYTATVNSATVHVYAFEDNTSVTVDDMTDSDDDWTGTLNTGQQAILGGFDDDEVHVTASNPICVAVEASAGEGGYMWVSAHDNGFLCGKNTYLSAVGKSPGDSSIDIVSTFGSAVSDVDIDDLTNDGYDSLNNSIDNTTVKAMDVGNNDILHITANGYVTVHNGEGNAACWETGRDVAEAVPSTNGSLVGKEFWFVGAALASSNNTYINAYEAATVTATRVSGGDGPWYFNVSAGDSYGIYTSSQFAHQLYHVESTGRISVVTANDLNDISFVVPSESGLATGTKFVFKSTNTGVGGYYEIWTLEDGTNIKITDKNDTPITSYSNQLKGTRITRTPGATVVRHVYSNKPVWIKCWGQNDDDPAEILPVSGYDYTPYSIISKTGKYYSEGNYKANVLDSGAVDTKIHQVGWNPSAQAVGTDVDVFARASNSLFAAGDGTPSWTSVSNGGDPALVGRYIQWMSTFTTTSSTTTPRIEDITLTYTSPPPAPAVNYNAGDSYTQVTWKWADNSSGQYQEDGFKIYSSTDGLIKSLSADVTYYVEAGLTRNTTYGRYIYAYNTAGSSNSITVDKKTQPCVWPEKVTTKTGKNSYGFEGDGVWTWEVPANGGSLVTITAYVRYDSNYGSADKPKITLYNKGVNSSASMTGAADTWEKLTVSGTPSEKGVLFLKVEGFSTAVGAKYFVDDIQVSQ